MSIWVPSKLSGMYEWWGLLESTEEVWRGELLSYLPQKSSRTATRLRCRSGRL